MKSYWSNNKFINYMFDILAYKVWILHTYKVWILPEGLIIVIERDIG
jgi:hypothetical protein